MVELRCVTLREYPPKGLRGSRVSVMVTEMLMGPESSRVCGDCVEDLACPLVTVLSGVVVSLRRCFKVSFSDIQKSKSLNLSRKVFQSFKQRGRFQGPEGAHASLGPIPPGFQAIEQKSHGSQSNTNTTRAGSETGKSFVQLRWVQSQLPPLS